MKFREVSRSSPRPDRPVQNSSHVSSGPQSTQYCRDSGTNHEYSRPQPLLYLVLGEGRLTKPFAALPFVKNASLTPEPPLLRRAKFPARRSNAKVAVPCSLQFRREDLIYSSWPSVQACQACPRRAHKSGPLV